MKLHARNISELVDMRQIYSHRGKNQILEIDINKILKTF